MKKTRNLSKVPSQLKKATERLIAEKDKGLGTSYKKSKPVSVMLPPALDEYVRSLPNRSEWIREAITEKWLTEQKTVESDLLEPEQN